MVERSPLFRVGGKNKQLPAGDTYTASNALKFGGQLPAWYARTVDIATSVRRFGAVGDGVTDDTAAIQAAIDSGSSCLYFPGGTYIITSLTARSNQSWLGDGMLRSTLSWAQANKTTELNMVVSSADLTGFGVADLGFRGNRAVQTTASSSGQGYNAFYLRGGSCTEVTFDRVHIQEFGDSGGVGGGGIIIGAMAGTGKALEDIRVRDCVFKNISNVPGLYLNGSSAYHTSVRNITISGCELKVGVANVRQNGFYILGGTTTPAYGVEMSGNRCFIDAGMDSCFELNYANTFAIANNTVVVTGSASCTAVLVREVVANGSVTGNAITNLGTGTLTSDAISLSRLSTGTQTAIIVANNVIAGWGPNGSSYAISVAAGSSRITVTGNEIIGRGPTTKTAGGVLVTGALVKVSDNTFVQVTYPVVMGAVGNLSVENNMIVSCGDGSVGIIVALSSAQAITNATIKNNTVITPVSGTPNFVNVDTSGISTYNRIENNLLPAGLLPVNPSLMSSWPAVVTPSRTGALMAGSDYQFDQGSLPMATGSGFTIGGNLDATAPACALGDKILVAASVDLQGCYASAYVQSANVIRVRVQNDTGATVTVAAATWYVAVIKRV